MRTSHDTADLFKAFVAAQADLKNASYDAVNPHFKNKYASLANIRDHVTPVLMKHGLAVIQGTEYADAAIAAVTTRLIHTSGQWIESAYPFALDKPQQMGSAMTYARRYSLAAICGIASEEDDDGEVGNQTDKKPAAAKATPKAEARPEYARISEGVKTVLKTGGIDDLNSWWSKNVAVIKGFTPDWKQQITKEFDDAREELSKVFA